MKNSIFIIVFFLSGFALKQALADDNVFINNFVNKLQKSLMHVLSFSALYAMSKLVDAESIMRSPDYSIVGSLSGFKSRLSFGFRSLYQKNRTEMILQQFETNPFWKIRPHDPAKLVLCHY
ncbi:hypothetical protein [Roseimarinus sediminis]|uniref:hypothetical protein n=1 Tax=Roseimarinus sediminis TaxID=1610899 RepID=UPI003D1E3CD7